MVRLWRPDSGTAAAELEDQFRALYDVTRDRSGRATAVWRRTLAELRARTLGSRRQWPDGGDLMLLKLCLSLFPVTDFRHQVLSPVKLLMSQWLVQCPVASVSDVAAGVGVVALFVDATAEAKRCVPEAVAFLHGVLALGASAKHARSALRHVPLPAFKALAASAVTADSLPAVFRGGLKAWCPADADAPVPKLPFAAFNASAGPGAATPAHHAAAVLGTVHRLLRCMLPVLTATDAAPQLLAPVVKAMGTVAVKSLHVKLQLQHLETHVALQQAVKRAVETRHHLELQDMALRLQPIKQFTPAFEMGFNPEVPEDAREAVRRLQRKVKREKKGAARDLKHEALVVARQTREKRLERDAERDAKYKEVVQFLEEQQRTGKEMEHHKRLAKR